MSTWQSSTHRKFLEPPNTSTAFSTLSTRDNEHVQQVYSELQKHNDGRQEDEHAHVEWRRLQYASRIKRRTISASKTSEDTHWESNTAQDSGSGSGQSNTN